MKQWKTVSVQGRYGVTIRINIMSGDITIANITSVNINNQDWEHARLIVAAPDLLSTIENALVSIKIMSMASNDEILKIMGDSFEAAIALVEKEG